MSRNAKIVCTIGPSSNSPEIIAQLIEAGMNVARLNFSHGTHDDHKKNIETIRDVSSSMNKPVGILQDLQGPKIRIKTFKEGPIHLTPGQTFTLTTNDVDGTDEIVGVSYPEFARDVHPGDSVLLDDGLLKLTVKEINGPNVICEVVHGGRLSDHKGLNLPGSILSVDALTEKDKADLKFGLAHDVDFVALSFVQRPDDIRELKNLIEAAGKNTLVVAKIEKPQAVESIESITDLAEVIMVARGDLGVELSAEEVPPIQKNIINICNKKGVPVITATQMLESMIVNPRPTRAEASDVANAILDGTDAVMLSGETASGKYPVQALETMVRIIELIEKDYKAKLELRRARHDFAYDPSLIIGYSVCHAADMLENAKIICLTQTGSTARMISRFRPVDPIIAVTHSDTSLRAMTLLWGVQACKVGEFKDNIDEAFRDISKDLKKEGHIVPGDRVIITAGLPFVQRRGTNMLLIEEVKDNRQ
jgi:pyruvate kinase